MAARYKHAWRKHALIMTLRVLLIIIRLFNNVLLQLHGNAIFILGLANTCLFGDVLRDLLAAHVKQRGGRQQDPCFRVREDCGEDLCTLLLLMAHLMLA